MYQIIKISTMINNIIQDQMVVIGKIIMNQIGITDIISKFIIRIIDSSKMLWDVFVVEMKAMLWMIVLPGRSYWGRREEFQTKSWIKCGHGRMGLISRG
jgi:hypothetical protein